MYDDTVKMKGALVKMFTHRSDARRLARALYADNDIQTL